LEEEKLDVPHKNMDKHPSLFCPLISEDWEYEKVMTLTSGVFYSKINREKLQLTLSHHQ
jgi:hypothetical protein